MRSQEVFQGLTFRTCEKLKVLKKKRKEKKGMNGRKFYIEEYFTEYQE
jgi:hypothetical protein